VTTDKKKQGSALVGGAGHLATAEQVLTYLDRPTDSCLVIENGIFCMMEAQERAEGPLAGIFEVVTSVETGARCLRPEPQKGS
jgi:hypothetical protein